MLRPEGFEPDFENIRRILEKKAPFRPTAYEFFWSDMLSARIAGETAYPLYHTRDDIRVKAEAFYRLGYDYANIHGSPFSFPAGEARKEETRSLNAGGVISDWDSLKAYPFQDPCSADYSRLDWGRAYLRPGMKFIVHGPLGVLENAIALAGYENLCVMLFDEPLLAEALFAEIGERLIAYFEICLRYESVGAILVNDDWGFNTQTMISPADLRKYVFPYHRRIVEAAHRAGKYAILHSCGNPREILEDVIESMKYDGRHSFEDKIMPVEQAYREYGGRISVMGGIDMHFMATKTAGEIFRRARRLIETTGCRGFALGTGNSVPEFVPDENFFAMLRALWENEYEGDA